MHGHMNIKKKHIYWILMSNSVTQKTPNLGSYVPEAQGSKIMKENGLVSLVANPQSGITPYTHFKTNSEKIQWNYADLHVTRVYYY